MNRTKWLFCTVLAAGLVGGGLIGAGCGSSPGVDGGMPVDMGGPPVDLGPAMTRVYVINSLQLPMPSSDGSEIDGFNLDGTADMVCGQADYNAPSFLGGAPGVDNSLSGFLGPLANDSIQKSVDMASVLLVIEVTDINSFVNDPSVTVTTYLAKLQPGATAGHVGACPTEMATDPNCRLAAGQTFDIDANSYVDGMAGTMPRITFPGASIVNGRLKGGPRDFPISLSFMGNTLSLTIRNASVDFGITDTTLTQGVLGGSINDMQLLDTIAAIPSICSYVDTVRPILAMYSDLMPTMTGACTLPDGGPGGNHCPSGSACDIATHMCVSCSEASIAIDLAGVAATKGTIVTTPVVDAGASMGCMMDAGAGTDGATVADAATGG